mmetsp:Transcript_57289/g.65319  ORF Transcript_57289/g.65319 Transcript_57289/m.65319 type:complete len:579 (+) Transcript_57289:36-1772(+)
MEAGGIDPMALLKQEMELDEVHLRVNAIHRVPTVAAVLGKSGTCSTLVPYLEGLTQTEDDEVLMAIAEQIGNLIPFVGDQLSVLAGILEQLCSQEETIVRKEGTASMIKLAAAMTDNDVNGIFVPAILRLAQSNWFTPRVSACNLFPQIYPRTSSSLKEKLRQKFVELCHEETQMVRRAGASNLGEFARKVEKEVLISEFIPILKQLSGDEQDNIRMLCMDSLVPIATILTKEENQRHTLSLILIAGEDKSWRVRLQFAKDFQELSKAFGKEITDMSLIQTLALLLKDIETDVRVAAITSLGKSILDIGLEKVQNMLLPILTNMTSDSAADVRKGLALTLSKLATSLGKQLTQQKIVPLMTELLKDDNPEVKAEMVNDLSRMAENLGMDVFSATLVENLNSLSTDTRWRVRAAISDIHTKLADLYGEDFFTKNFAPTFFTYLEDTASSVRENGIKNTGLLASKFKEPWIKDHVLPKLKTSLNTEWIFHRRIGALNTIREISYHLNRDAATELLGPGLIQGVQDQIPNVRFCTLRIVLAAKNNFTDAFVKGELKNAIMQVKEDSDRDVRHFASLALESI